MRVTRKFFLDFLRSRIAYTKVYAFNSLFGQKYLFSTGDLDAVLAFMRRKSNFYEIRLYTFDDSLLLASCKYIEHAHRFRYDIY